MTYFVPVPAEYIYLVHRSARSYALDLGYSYARHSQRGDGIDENIIEQFEHLKEYAALAADDKSIKGKLDQAFQEGIDDFEDVQED